MREFEQMEMQFFIRPGSEEKWYAFWKEQRIRWHRALGISVAGNGSAYVVGLTRSSDFPTTNKAIQPKFAGGGRDGFVTALDPSGSKLVYSTYLGGSGDDQAWIGPTHSDGTIWVIGLTSSTDFPVTSGAFQTASAGGFDCFVTKIDPLGTQIIFSSYVGGGGDDNCIDGTVDAQGHALLTGSTSSTNFPTTAGAFQRAYGGGATDAVVAKVALDGSSLVYSTYLGGSGDEDVSDGRFDDSGNAYVPGVTSSLDFPTTPGALQSRFAGGPEDGYLTVLNPTGSGLLYSTYFGGRRDRLARVERRRKVRRVRRPPRAAGITFALLQLLRGQWRRRGRRAGREPRRVR